MKRSALLVLMLATTGVKAGDIATERTQAASAALLTFLMDVNSQIKEFTDQIETFERQAGAVMEGDAWEGVDAIDNVFEIFRGIEALIQEGDALAHTGQDSERFFRERYDDYTGFYDELTTRGYIDRQPVVERLQTWNNTHRSTIMNTLRAHGIHADEIVTAEQRLSLLQEKSRTAAGRMQALQVGQELASEQIKQMHGLKEILMEQSNLHSSYFAYVAATKADQEAHSEYLHREIMPTIIGNEVGAILP